MTVQPNAEFTFMDYEVRDFDILLHFVCYYPGAGEPNDYYVGVTDAELGNITSANQFKDLVLAKLGRKIRADNLVSKLDPYIGQSVVV